jgi:acyl-CoA synthetase (AMP-forming)/AMP-acid ligase II
MGSFPFLHMGLPQVLVRAYEPALAVELIARHRVTSTGMTSGMLAVLLDALPGDGLPSLRRVLYGGAPFSPAQLRRAFERLGPSLVQVYGNLAGGWPLTILDPDDHAAVAAGDLRLAGSCGRVADGAVELRVGPDGGLCTRSAMTVADYTDSDGWCRLGDRAHIEDDGYVFLAGRLDSMVNTGYHVYPEEVQGALEALAGIAAARVVGEPDERRGEVLAAYVVPRPDADLEAEAIRQALRERLAAYKVPRVIWIVDELDADQTTQEEVQR